ncbi:unnamed protein product [Prunus armeniaca]|uniref:Uncharacterized protein n=1 Tax=Prunus armeniaca TaxID=36596 RepID=A0A6J5UB99_PRUAR|nr:unnamed protein product [Prunus armeniaca]
MKNGKIVCYIPGPDLRKSLHLLQDRDWQGIAGPKAVSTGQMQSGLNEDEQRLLGTSSSDLWAISYLQQNSPCAGGNHWFVRHLRAYEMKTSNRKIILIIEACPQGYWNLG